jgi:hypothetical protein
MVIKELRFVWISYMSGKYKRFRPKKIRLSREQFKEAWNNKRKHAEKLEVKRELIYNEGLEALKLVK